MGGDWLFFVPLAVYALALVLAALYARRGETPLDSGYFLAGRNLKAPVAFISVMATESSVATIVIFPAVGLAGGLSLLWLCAGFILGRLLIARYFLGVIYERHRLSLYKDMAGPDERTARGLSLFYLLGKYISGGVRFFLGAYALHQVFHWDLGACILIIAFIVGLYSISGGLRAVVFTDQIQGLLILALGAYLLVRLFLDVPPDSLRFPSLWNADFRPDNSLYFPGLLLGGIALSIGTHGADQDMLQRVLAVRSLPEARRALVLSGFAAAAVILIYLGIGVLLGQEGAYIADKKSPLSSYIAARAGPLLKGSFAVLLIAAAMSTLDSAIHSTGAVWKALFSPNGRSGRVWSFLSLGVFCVFAWFFQEAQAHERSSPEGLRFIDLAMGSMNYVNGGLIGTLCLYVFYPRRLNGRAALAATSAGFLITLLCNYALSPPLAWTWTIVASASGAILAGWFAGGTGPGR